MNAAQAAGWAVLLLAIALPGVAGAKTWDIEIVETGDPAEYFQFRPRDLTITVGDSVRWTDRAPASHTATSAAAGFDHAFDNEPGDTFTFRFDEAGRFTYLCKPHDWMAGVITVIEDDEAHGPGPVPSPDGGPDGGPDESDDAPALPAVALGAALACAAIRRRTS